MATSPRTRAASTLAEFLRTPGIDERPYLEFIDGRIEAKVSPQAKHSRLAKRFLFRLDSFAEPRGLGESFPELRCTFGGRSIIPDVVFLFLEHIPSDPDGRIVGDLLRPPDLQIEIVSPDQSLTKTRAKLRHSTAHGCPLGWLVNPEPRLRKWIEVYRPGRAPERLPADGVLDGAPVLPGFRLAVAEVFGWLVHRRPGGRSE